MEAVSPTEVLRIQGSKWFLKDRELTKGEIDNLQSEADVISKTALWKLLVNEGRYHAQKRAIIDANTGDNDKDMNILRDAQAYHRVVTMFNEFIIKTR